MRRLLLSLLLLLPFNVSALEMGYIYKSTHFNNKYDYNEKHNGVFFKHKGLFAASFTNSYDNAGSMVGMYQTIKLTRSMYLDINYGLVTGYGWDRGFVGYDTKILPAISPTLSARFKRFRANLHFLGSALGTSISVQF